MVRPGVFELGLDLPAPRYENELPPRWYDVHVSRATTGRTYAEPLGDESVPVVKQGSLGLVHSPADLVTGRGRVTICLP